MTKERLHYLQEVAKSKGKQLFLEYTTFEAKDVQVEMLKESPTLVEKIGDQNISCRGIIRNFPVTRFIENKNGRIYPKSLWERVEEKGSFNRGFALADHAEKEGSVKDVVGVWHNFRVLEDCCVADLYCVGERGQLMLEIVSAKGLLGSSTVGMGDFLSDGKTVNPDTYELSEESKCDIVLNPSQSVFATLESSILEIPNNQVELRNSNSKLPTNKIEENVIVSNKNITVDDNLNESTKGAIMSEDVKNVIKLQESNIRLRVKETVRASKKLLEEKNVDSLRESKENLKDLLTTIPLNLSEQILQIESQIEMIEDVISEVAKTKLKELDTTSATLGETNVKLASTLKEKEALESKLSEAEIIVTQLKEDTEKTNSELKEALSKAVKDVIMLVEHTKLRDSDISKFEESYVNLKEDVVMLKIKGRKWKEAFDTTLSKLNNTREEFNKAVSIVEKIKSKAESLKEENEILREMVLNLKKSSKMKEGGSPTRDGIDKKKGFADFAGSEEEEYTINEPSKLQQYEADKNKSYATVESTNSDIRKGLESLYIKESAKYPSIKVIKPQILKAESYIEAMTIIEDFLEPNSFREKSPIKESVIDNGYYKDDWLPKGWN